MIPGRELDALVAEKVMGWKLLCYESGIYATEPGQYDDGMNNDGWLWEGDSVNREAYEFRPSTDIAAAWEVVEKIGADGESQYELLQNDAPGEMDMWCARITHPAKSIVCQYADTAPHAICLAALKAVGWKRERK